jgi:hypothetical protein
VSDDNSNLAIFKLLESGGKRFGFAGCILLDIELQQLGQGGCGLLGALQLGGKYACDSGGSQSFGF